MQARSGVVQLMLVILIFSIISYCASSLRLTASAGRISASNGVMHIEASKGIVEIYYPGLEGLRGYLLRIATRCENETSILYNDSFRLEFGCDELRFILWEGKNVLYIFSRNRSEATLFFSQDLELRSLYLPGLGNLELQNSTFFSEDKLEILSSNYLLLRGGRLGIVVAFNRRPLGLEVFSVDGRIRWLRIEFREYIGVGAVGGNQSENAIALSRQFLAMPKAVDLRIRARYDVLDNDWGIRPEKILFIPQRLPGMIEVQTPAGEIPGIVGENFTFSQGELLEEIARGREEGRNYVPALMIVAILILLVAIFLLFGMKGEYFREVISKLKAPREVRIVEKSTDRYRITYEGAMRILSDKRAVEELSELEKKVLKKMIENGGLIDLEEGAGTLGLSKEILRSALISLSDKGFVENIKEYELID